jgi:hypothetical protein
MEYNYERYEMILTEFLQAMWRDEDNLEIGEDISDIQEVKIIFDGYGDLEDEDEDGEYRYTEGGNKNMESYAIFIHKDALAPEFVFPEHTSYAFTFGSMIQHRPAEEVWIYAWYDVESEQWDILPLEDRLDEDSGMTAEDVMNVLEGIFKEYYEASPFGDGVKRTDWPFPKLD